MEGRNKGGAVQVYLDIALSLKERILKKELPEGERLPGEIELAKSYGVNRLTVRKSLDKLSKEGFIKTVRGKGSYALPQKPDARLKNIVILSGGAAALQSSTMRSVACAAMLAMKNRGFMISFELARDLERILEADASGERVVSGMIVLRTAIYDNEKVEGLLKKAGFPVVAEGETVESLDCVAIDNKQVLKEVFEHLWGLGHRRIGVVWSPNVVSSEIFYRMKCVRETLAEKGVLNEDFICSMREYLYGPKDSDPDLDAFFSKPADKLPTAIITFSDTFAINVVKAARRRGLSVPLDLSVTGFDNMAAGSFFEPSISSVTNDYWSLGEAAAKLLLERMDNSSSRKRKILLKQSFIIRESCAPPKI